jgi:hypothetical protein
MLRRPVWCVVPGPESGVDHDGRRGWRTLSGSALGKNRLAIPSKVIVMGVEKPLIQMLP